MHKSFGPYPMERFIQAVPRYYITQGFELSKIVTLLDASTFCEELICCEGIHEWKKLKETQPNPDFSVVLRGVHDLHERHGEG